MKMITAQEHTELIHRKDADKEVISSSFLRLFEQHRGMLYAIALRMLGYGEDAKDAVQETFIKAYTHLHTLQDKAALGGWLKSIMHRHCLMELRCRKKKTVVLHAYAREKELITEAVHDAEKAPEEIKSTLTGLSETLQLPAMLRFFSKNSSYQQIATILSIPVGTVRSRLAESRVKLASLLAHQNHPVKNNKVREMEDFYHFHFPDIYDDPIVRNAFLDHFDEHVSISLTSGKTMIGSEYMKKEIEFDLMHGARATLAEVNSSGNVSIIEIVNINPPEKPDLCPSAGTFIAVHPRHKVEKMYLHNAPKLPHRE
jgi:RNA polymerase sigma-70 factor (ECF subfamily)